LSYRSFEAKDIVGKAHIGNDEIGLDQFEMSVADGKFRVHGLL